MGDFLNDNLGKIMVIVGVLVIAAGISFVVWHERPISGDVRNREFSAAHYETRFRRQCMTTTTGYGKNRNTATSCVTIPYTVWLNDRWSIEVCDKERCKWVDIDQTRFLDTQVGSHFSEKQQ